MNHIVNRFIYNGLREESRKTFHGLRVECLVFLNTDMNRSLFKLSFMNLDMTRRYLWKTTAFHVTADGAANHLFDMFPESREQFIPDYIIVSFCC